MHSVLYFVGLLMCAVATAVLTTVPPYGFLVVGGGLIIYPVFTLVIYPIVKKITR